MVLTPRYVRSRLHDFQQMHRLSSRDPNYSKIQFEDGKYGKSPSSQWWLSCRPNMIFRRPFVHSSQPSERSGNLPAGEIYQYA